MIQLLDGQRAAAELLVAARSLIHASFGETLRDGPLSSDDQDLLKYLVARMADRRRETMIALFADEKSNFIQEEEVGEGGPWTVAVYPRILFGRALALDARSILLVHNHPSGSARASRADVTSTRALVQQAKQLVISIIDHLIVGGSQIYSMKKGRDW